MRCSEILDLLCDYLDSELDDVQRAEVRKHLDACAGCQRSYAELAAVKRVVQAKIVQPPLPGGLAGRVLRNTRSAPSASETGRFSRRQLISGLAAMLSIGFLIGALVWLDDRSPIAHARAMSEITGGFDSVTVATVDIDSTLKFKSDEELLALIRADTRVALDGLPKIHRAHLLNFTLVQIAGRDCVRLDYRDECVADTAVCSVLSVFAIPLSEVEDPHLDKMKDLCQCIQVEGLSIYCFRNGETSMNLVHRGHKPDFSGRIGTTPSCRHKD